MQKRQLQTFTGYKENNIIHNDLKFKFSYFLEFHFSHVKNISNEQMDQLLSIIVDAEVLYTTLGLQKDKFIKKIYSFLFTFMHQCVAERKPAIIQGRTRIYSNLFCDIIFFSKDHLEIPKNLLRNPQFRR